uniref:Protein capI n=1 Tax=Arundo donax TaxID=35708 RepID=A0A0A9EH69_ARUDO
MPPSRRGVALRRTSRSHAAPPYDAAEPIRLRCEDRDDGRCGDADEEEEGSAERRNEWESRDG